MAIGKNDLRKLTADVAQDILSSAMKIYRINETTLGYLAKDTDGNEQVIEIKFGKASAGDFPLQYLQEKDFNYRQKH